MLRWLLQRERRLGRRGVLVDESMDAARLEGMQGDGGYFESRPSDDESNSLVWDE